MKKCKDKINYSVNCKQCNETNKLIIMNHIILYHIYFDLNVQIEYYVHFFYAVVRQKVRVKKISRLPTILL